MSAHVEAVRVIADLSPLDPFTRRDANAIVEALSAAGLLATGEELFAIRWDMNIAGLSKLSNPMPDRDRVEASLANSAFGGVIVRRFHAEWVEVTP